AAAERRARGARVADRKRRQQQLGIRRPKVAELEAAMRELLGAPLLAVLVADEHARRTVAARRACETALEHLREARAALGARLPGRIGTARGGAVRRRRLACNGTHGN